MIPREYMDKMAELEEENRQLRAIAFGERIALPLEWRLTYQETALVRCLMVAEQVCYDRWASAVSARHPHATLGGFWVCAWKVRGKLEPHGIVLQNHRSDGYWLSTRDRHRLRAACDTYAAAQHAAAEAMVA